MSEIAFDTLPVELQEQLLRLAAKGPSLGICMSRPVEIRLTVAMAPRPKPEHGPDLLSLPGMTFEEIRREVILRAVARHGGSRTAAARELGIARSTVVGFANGHKGSPAPAPADVPQGEGTS